MALKTLIASDVERERGAVVRHLRRRAMYWDRVPSKFGSPIAKALRNEALAIEAAEHLKSTD